VAQLQQELSQLKQIGTAEEYVHSLQRVLKNLRQAVVTTAGAEAAEIIEPMTQKQALTSFLTNVRSDVGLILKARNPATLEEATQIASDEELVQRAKGNTSSRYSPPQNRPYQPNYQNNPNPRPSYSQPNRPQFQPRQQTNQHQSFPNHTYNNFRSQQPLPVLIKQEGVCTYCQIPGHDIYSCPEPNCRLSGLNQGPPTRPNNGGPQNTRPYLRTIVQMVAGLTRAQATKHHLGRMGPMSGQPRDKRGNPNSRLSHQSKPINHFRLDSRETNKAPPRSGRPGQGSKSSRHVLAASGIISGNNSPTTPRHYEK
jgi:hypothetical protein